MVLVRVGQAAFDINNRVGEDIGTRSDFLQPGNGDGQVRLLGLAILEANLRRRLDPSDWGPVRALGGPPVLAQLAEQVGDSLVSDVPRHADDDV